MVSSGVEKLRRDVRRCAHGGQIGANRPEHQNTHFLRDFTVMLVFP